MPRSIPACGFSGKHGTSALTRFTLVLTLLTLFFAVEQPRTTLANGINKTPALSSISPNSAVAGGAGLTLNVTGSNFSGQSAIVWNGSQRPTIAISSTQLQATILSSDIASTGTNQVAVYNPGPKGGTSNSMAFTVAAAAISIVTATLPNTVLGATYSATLAASGGVPPYSWNLSSGQLPIGLSLSVTGAVAGVSTTAGSYSSSIQVSDSLGIKASKAYIIAVASPLSVLTSTLPSGTANVTYSATLSASGGTPPYTWSLSAGSLSAGLALSTSGVISGTPTTAGSSTFSVQAADSGGQKASQSFSLSIAAATAPLSITTTSLANGTVGTVYSAALTASGGVQPCTWTLASGQLPAGLTLSASGLISGTPTTAASSTFTLQVVDSSGQKASQSYTVSIAGNSTSDSIITNSLSLAYIQQPYSAALTASGGTAPYAWSVTSGSLPSGLGLNSTTGQLSGTPTQGGNSLFTITATDSVGNSTSKSFNVQVFEQPLDQYGGLANAPSASGGSGYFRLEKTPGGRWLLVTPAGHYMWMNAVSSLAHGDGGTTYSTAIAKKYGNATTWANQATRRVKSWGFNVIGDYYDAGSYNVLPVKTYNLPANLTPMPFIRLIKPSSWCLGSTYQVKNLYAATNHTYLNIARGFPDVFDPNWSSCANYVGANGGGEFQPALPNTTPWMLGTAVDDGDNIFGFTRSTEPHLGWVTAVTSPLQVSSGSIVYTNQTVYAKQQWQSYLQAKYVTIAALNTAWGSTYTTFGSAGGWPKSTTHGTGLMDEDGSSSWIGTGVNGPTITRANAAAAADMDAFLTMIADKYFSTLRTACKTAYPNHLVLGPGSLNAQTYSPVMQKAGQYMDLPQVWVEPVSTSTLPYAYNVMGKPMYVFTTQTSNEDSDGNTGAPWGGACTGDYDFCTQADRGTGYQNVINSYWNTQGADGSYPVVGSAWWEWVDKVSEGENFGLVSVWDNAYDSLEDQVSAGRDSWGFVTGNQPHDHGDFLGAVTQQNLDIMRAIITAP